jgi:hypothetical protein
LASSASLTSSGGFPGNADHGVSMVYAEVKPRGHKAGLLPPAVAPTTLFRLTVLDGEVNCFDGEGRPRFYEVMFGRAARSVLDGAGHRAGRLWTK